MSSPQPPGPTQPPLVAALERYQQALDALTDDPQTLLPALLARDRVEAAQQKAQPPPGEQIQQIVILDGRLRQQAAKRSLADLPGWRQTLRPSNAAWWWFLDQEAEERDDKNDLPWVLVTGTLLTLIAPLAIEIVKRLWDGAPDSTSIFGTLLTLLVTGSPLFKRGQEVGQWALKRIPGLKPHFRAEAMAGMAALAFVALLVGQVWLLPGLAIRYNNQGFAAMQVGNLAQAQQKFQRAAALNPDLEVPYYNLADVYQRINRPDEAQAWYQKAIERDLNFALAYRGLGHLYNTQGMHEKAEGVLLTGLSQLDAAAAGGDRSGRKEALVARYELLADLGWAYFAQERYERAQEALEAAVALEEQLKPFEERDEAQYRLPLPHYYLAQIYEQLGRPADAYQQWEDCLRLLGRDWAYQEWRATARERLDALEDSF
jgi:tetratricopeptide (TPR) repeat protein